MFVVFDLDGTLADLTHRLGWVRNLRNEPDFKPNWDAFHETCIFDEPIPEMIKLNNMLADAGAYIEIWSGRSDAVREQTMGWLHKHGVAYTKLLMRSSGDHTPDHELKASWLEWPFMEKVPDIIFDDRKRVVDMWRAKGIRCVQVAPGEF